MKVLIIGATSAIAQETTRLFAKDEAELYLVARSQEKLIDLKKDLLVRGATRVNGMALDLCLFDRHQELVDNALSTMNGLDAVLIAHGTLSNQKRCEQSVPDTIQEMTTNCLSTISILTILANYFEQQRKGCIAVISSVAGDRGRQSNYVYGAGKGAVSIYLQGLRNRLSSSGVSVVTIKPGFVDTPMTEDIKKNALFTNAVAVGKRIYHAMKQSKDVVYVPWYWSPIMTMIRGIPERVFKTLSL